MRKVARVIATGVACIAAANAFGQDRETLDSASGSLALATDYPFRGISNTNERPRLRGDVSWAHGSGFYAGIWSTNTHFGGEGNTIELDPYVGWASSFGESEISYDIGLWYYVYPGAVSDFDFGELYVILSAPLGTFRIQGDLWYANDYFGNDFFPDSPGLAYHAVLSHELGNDFAIAARLGEQLIDQPVGLPEQDYTYYDLTVTKDWNQLTFSLAWHDTSGVRPELAADDLADQRVVAGVQINF